MSTGNGETESQYVVEETLVEMAYRWGDIELQLGNWTTDKGEHKKHLGRELSDAISHAFRVEAHATEESDDFGNEWTDYEYVVFFDVSESSARDGAQVVRTHNRFLVTVVDKLSGGESRSVSVRVTSKGAPTEGQVCGRMFADPPKKHIDISDVPDEKPNSDVPLTKKDGYWLTPIEVPFYDALRDTGLVFAVQPWVQGVESRFRLDFLLFYDGGMVAVELDGHETHKSKDQRQRDARRDRWFAARGVRTLRWTGSEVHANAQDCVRQLLEILRGAQARP